MTVNSFYKTNRFLVTTDLCLMMTKHFLVMTDHFLPVTNHFLVTIFQKLADARPFFGDDCKFLLRDRAFFGDYLPFLAVPWWFFAGAERFLGKNGELPRRVRATPSEEGELVNIFLTLDDLSDNSRPATSDQRPATSDQRPATSLFSRACESYFYDPQCSKELPCDLDLNCLKLQVLAMLVKYFV